MGDFTAGVASERSQMIGAGYTSLFKLSGDRGIFMNLCQFQGGNANGSGGWACAEQVHIARTMRSTDTLAVCLSRLVSVQVPVRGRATPPGGTVSKQWPTSRRVDGHQIE